VEQPEELELFFLERILFWVLALLYCLRGHYHPNQRSSRTQTFLEQLALILAWKELYPTRHRQTASLFLPQLFMVVEEVLQL
jgi:hypothetical protein